MVFMEILGEDTGECSFRVLFFFLVVVGLFVVKVVFCSFRKILGLAFVVFMFWMIEIILIVIKILRGWRI